MADRRSDVALPLDVAGNLLAEQANRAGGSGSRVHRSDQAMITALGWLGSALIVASLAMHRRIPFRLLNLISAIVLLAFNFAIGLWSMVALNAAVLVVNAWHLQKLFAATRRQTLLARKPRLSPAPPAEGWFTRPEQPHHENPTYDRLTLVPKDVRKVSVASKEHT